MIFLTGLVAFFAGALLVNLLGDSRPRRTNNWDYVGGLISAVGCGLMLTSFAIMLFRHLP